VNIGDGDPSAFGLRIRTHLETSFEMRSSTT
jgi:hypothetical protein